MLKLTETELAEMGFVGNNRFACWSGESDILYFFKESVWNLETSEDSGSVFYPQTKEDLLMLIRLFTPPKPLPANHCYSCDGTGGDCAVDCKHCKGTGVIDVS